jgi:hypothetical protein
VKNNTCPIVLHRLSLVRRFVDDLFVPDVPVFENFMYLDQDFFGGSIQKHLVSSIVLLEASLVTSWI